MKSFFFSFFFLFVLSAHAEVKCYKAKDCAPFSNGSNYVCCNPGPKGYCVYNPTPSACKKDEAERGIPNRVEDLEAALEEMKEQIAALETRLTSCESR